MERAFFISETFLKDNTPISGNVDIAEIYPFAKTAEETLIQEAIGTSLFDDLIDKINLAAASPPTVLSADDIVLLKKIRLALMWYTVHNAIPFIATKIRNIGVVQQSGENLTNADGNTIANMQKTCKMNGDFYLRLVQKYLCKNHALYPAYDVCDCGAGLPANRNYPSPGLDIAFLKNYYRD